MVANAGITGMTTSQQAQVIKALHDASGTHERVCILRDSSQGVVLPPGALTKVLNKYSSVVASVGTYTISTRK